MGLSHYEISQAREMGIEIRGSETKGIYFKD